MGSVLLTTEDVTAFKWGKFLITLEAPVSHSYYSPVAFASLGKNMYTRTCDPLNADLILLLSDEPEGQLSKQSD